MYPSIPRNRPAGLTARFSAMKDFWRSVVIVRKRRIGSCRPSATMVRTSRSMYESCTINHELSNNRARFVPGILGCTNRSKCSVLIIAIAICSSAFCLLVRWYHFLAILWNCSLASALKLYGAPNLSQHESCTIVHQSCTNHNELNTTNRA